MSTFTNTEIIRLFRTNLAKKTLLMAEEEGRIPKAERVQRGRVSMRKWHISDIPAIGEKYGFLKKPDRQQVISFYTGKGGVLKTTLAYNFARTLALNGIKTIIIGLDIQESITSLALDDDEIHNLNEIQSTFGLYDYLINEEPIESVVRPTDIPTLDIIPETSDLNLLEKALRDRPRREYVISKQLLPKLKEYDIVIFDNSPNWNLLIENSLTASNVVIAPISCEVGTYQALEKNTNVLLDFKAALELHWEDYIMIPTLLEKSKISQQVLGAYFSNYDESITNATIRRAAKGQESMAIKQSIFEYANSSELANDYYELITEVWERINKVVN